MSDVGHATLPALRMGGAREELYRVGSGPKDFPDA